MVLKLLFPINTANRQQVVVENCMSEWQSGQTLTGKNSECLEMYRWKID